MPHLRQSTVPPVAARRGTVGALALPLQQALIGGSILFVAVGCRWSDLDVPARFIPAAPLDERSLGTSTAHAPYGDRASAFSIDFPETATWDGTERSTGATLLLDEPLMLENVLELVRSRHPSMRAAEAAMNSARENYPQVTSLDDPQFRFLSGPTIFGSDSGAHLWRLQMQQKLPWFSKRTLWGELADQKARIAESRWAETQAELMDLAADAFLEYALSEQLGRHAKEQRSLRDVEFEELLPHPTAPLVSPDQERSAWDELAYLELLRLEAEAVDKRSRAVRRLNRLLGRPADAPLPAAWLPPLPTEAPELEVLMACALDHLPELIAARARLRMAEHELQLARMEFFPDPEIVGRFDTNADQFWAPDRAAIRPQLGVNIHLPIRQERRWARVRQAQWEISRFRAELHAVEKQVKEEVHENYANWKFAQYQLATAERMVELAQRQFQSLQSADHPADLDAHLREAHRKLVDCQIERAHAEFAARRQLLRLFAQSGWPLTAVGWQQ